MLEPQRRRFMLEARWQNRGCSMNTRIIRASLAMVLLGAGAQAAAAESPTLEPIAEPGPAAIANTDEAPEITIRKRGRDRVEEYRMRGQLYMVKVTPRIGKPYYLVDPRGDGRFVRRDSFDTGLIVPTWVLKTW
jgi:hypothetical protein